MRRTHRTAASDAALGGCAAADPPLGVDRRDGDATASATGVAAHQKSEYGSNFGWSASRHSDVDVSAQVMAANRGEIAIRIFRAATEARCCSASASRRLSALPTPAPRKRRPGSPSAPLPRLLRWTSRRSPSTPRRTLTRCTGAIMFRLRRGSSLPHLTPAVPQGRTKADEAFLVGQDKSPVGAYLSAEEIVQIAKACREQRSG